MATSNDSFDCLPHGFVASTLFVLADLCIVFDIVLRRDILLVCFLLLQHPILSPTKDLEHHDALGFPGPNLQKLGGMQSVCTSGTPLSFLCSDQEN
jgi:hypothetical protein